MPVRRLERGDLEFASKLTIDEGWDYTPVELDRMLELDPEGSFVYEDKKRLGFATCVTYGRTGVLGHLVVSSEGRGKGIGKALLSSSMDYMEGRGVDSMIIYSTPDGLNLYRKHGFEVIGEMLCYHGRLERNHGYRRSPSCVPVTEDDLEMIISIDHGLFGDDRGRLYRAMHRWFPASSFKIVRDGKIAGFIMGRPDHDGHNLGPWICTSGRAEDAEALFDTLLSTFPRGIVYLGVFASNKEAVRIVEGMPTDRTWRIPITIKGKPRYGTDVGKVFGVAGMELG